MMLYCVTWISCSAAQVSCSGGTAFRMCCTSNGGSEMGGVEIMIVYIYFDGEWEFCGGHGKVDAVNAMIFCAL